jgi:hypothetical protein
MGHSEWLPKIPYTPKKRKSLKAELRSVRLSISDQRETSFTQQGEHPS